MTTQELLDSISTAITNTENPITKTVLGEVLANIVNWTSANKQLITLSALPASGEENVIYIIPSYEETSLTTVDFYVYVEGEFSSILKTDEISQQIEQIRSDVSTALETTVGKSAYEIWLQVEGNGGKTIAEFIASLKGEPGTISSLQEVEGYDLLISDVMDKIEDETSIANKSAVGYTITGEEYLMLWNGTEKVKVSIGQIITYIAYQVYLQQNPS